MDEIIILVEESTEGGYTANALNASIFTEAETIPDLKNMVKDAVKCHYEENEISSKTIVFQFVG